MFNCTRCSFLGKSKVQLEIHIEKNHRKNLYKCEKCGCTTNSKYYYLRHNERCQEDKTLICEYCPYKVTNEVLGRDNLESYHSVLSDTKTVTVLSSGLKSPRLKNVKAGWTSRG